MSSRTAGWGCLLLGALILVLGFALFDRLMDQSRPPVPPAIVTVVVVQTATPPAVTMSPVQPHRTPAVIDLRPERLPMRSPIPTPTATSTPTATPVPTVTPVPERSPVQRG